MSRPGKSNLGQFVGLSRRYTLDLHLALTLSANLDLGAKLELQTMSSSTSANKQLYYELYRRSS